MTNKLLRWVAGLFSPPATSKEEILKASKPVVKEVYVPQFNATVYLRRLSVKDARKLRDETPKNSEEKPLDTLADELELYYARLMAFCILDKDYQPIYTVEQIFDFDVDVYNQFFFEITDFNKLNLDIEQIKEELKKNQVTSTTTS